MKDFFKTYPNAKSCWKVGDRYFLHSYREQAELYAAQTGQKVEEYTKPKPTAAKPKAGQKNKVSDGTE